MEEAIPCKSVEVSDNFKAHLKEAYDYSCDTFGYAQAERYMQKIEKTVDTLYNSYLLYPECRYLATKNRLYRNIILDTHLIIYQIADERIEVLDIIHGASSIGKIRRIRKIRL